MPTSGLDLRESDDELVARWCGPGALVDPRGALTALSLDAAKVTVNAATLGTRFRR